jgi:DNA invertase Pin-like site-specific DNA recombinase
MLAKPHDQNLNLQRDALIQARCDQIFEDTTSGARAERPGLAGMKEQFLSVDILVAWPPGPARKDFAQTN